MHLPENPRDIKDPIPTAKSADHGGQSMREQQGKERLKVTGTAPTPRARGFPESRAPRPSAPRTDSPAPPHPTPSSLHERKWESQRRGPAETKQRRPRGGRFGAEGPGTTLAHTPLLHHGRTHPLRFDPVAPARNPGPAGKSSGAGSKCSVYPGKTCSSPRLEM